MAETPSVPEVKPAAPAATPKPAESIPAPRPAKDLFLRFAEVDSDSADDDSMEVQVAFSSEAPVLRKAGAAEESLGIATRGTKYFEVLSHAEGDADFSALNRTAPLLDEHKDAIQLGSVKRAKLSKDKRGRAVLKFDGVTELSKTRYGQMKGGSRPHISFGYTHTRFIKDDGMKDGIPLKRIAFAADEISSVARPADPTVGVRRSAAGDWACLCCGDLFRADKLNENFECETCSNPETRNQKESMNRAALRDLSQLFTRAESGKISYNDLRSWVNTAACADERFNKNAKGEVRSYCWVADIVVEEIGVVDGQDKDVYRAIINSADNKYYEVAFTFGDGKVSLGDAVTVAPVTRYEKVSRSAAAQVDSPKLAEKSQTRENHLPNTPMPEAPAPIQVDEKAIRTAERDAAKQRAKEITAIADEFIKDHGKRNGGKLELAMRKLANEALATDLSVADFKVRCLTEVVAAKPATPITLASVANGEDTTEYSVLRGIQSCITRKSNVPDGLEGEIHQEILNRAKTNGGLGYDSEGFQVPQDAKVRAGNGLDRARMQRDMQATVFGAGGAFVPTNLQVPIIELLRNRMILDKVGVRQMAGLQGNIVIPRQEAAATAYSVTEIGLLQASQQVLGQISMSPKRVGATQTYSKQFVMQSTPDAEAFMRDDLFKVIALRWDVLGLNGQGANAEPLGIINTPGVASVLFGATPTYAKIVSFETLIRAANVTDPIAYVTTPTVKGTLKITPATLTGSTVVSGASNALWTGSGDSGEMNGYPAFDTNQVPNNLVLAGAFNQLIHAVWGGLDVVVDQVTKAGNAEIVLTINTWGDFAVRHPQAFVISADAGNQ